jgi:hypothetical protein
MKYTTVDYLRVVAPYVPLQLVSARRLSRITEIAATLPPSSNFGFECELGSRAAEADFLVAVIPSDGSRSAWAGARALAAEPDVTRSHPTWKRIRGFFDGWSRSAAGFEPVYDTWLEFDLDDQGSGVPTPSFFFGFDHLRSENYPAEARALLDLILERSLPRGASDRLRACWDALPQKAHIFQVGVMLARPTNAVRLCVQRLAPDQIIPYLARVGWPGSAGELRRLIDEIAGFVDGIGLDIDVGETVLPKIGLECSINDGAAGRAKLRALLEHLTTRGHCVPEKGAALLQWLGYCTERSDRERWPAHLLKASKDRGDDVMSAFGRTLSHVKVTYQDDARSVAKAYLGVRHYWITARSRAAS